MPEIGTGPESLPQERTGLGERIRTLADSNNPKAKNTVARIINNLGKEHIWGQINTEEDQQAKNEFYATLNDLELQISHGEDYQKKIILAGAIQDLTQAEKSLPKTPPETPTSESRPKKPTAKQTKAKSPAPKPKTSPETQERIKAAAKKRQEAAEHLTHELQAQIRKELVSPEAIESAQIALQTSISQGFIKFDEKRLLVQNRDKIGSDLFAEATEENGGKSLKFQPQRLDIQRIRKLDEVTLQTNTPNGGLRKSFSAILDSDGQVTTLFFENASQFANQLTTDCDNSDTRTNLLSFLKSNATAIGTRDIVIPLYLDLCVFQSLEKAKSASGPEQQKYLRTATLYQVLKRRFYPEK